MRFTYVKNGALPPAQALSVACVDAETNQPLPPMTVALRGVDPWVTLAPLTGSTVYQIQISVQPGALAPGTYTSAIVITQTGEEIVNPEEIVPVELLVMERPPTPDRVPRILFQTPDGTVFKGNNKEFLVAVADDVGVTVVELYVGEPPELVATQSVHKPGHYLPASVQLQWMEDRIPKGNYLLTAKAYNDLGGMASAQIHVKRA